MSEKGMTVIQSKRKLPGCQLLDLDFCEDCVLGKQKVSFIKVTRTLKIEKLELVDIDVWGPLQISAISGSRKLSIHLPQPFGLVYLGKYYLALTTFCFAATSNAVNLTDGLDGLAGGVVAWAFIGMSVAIFAISPDLAVLGVSMAGACVGFLFHNRYKASIFMGDTGSLGLGGALAAMASCTGMFLPLFISSGVLIMEVLSVILQVLFMKVTRKLYGVSRRVFRMAPIHHHFELCGYKEPVIVASAYFISCILALIAGYTGIIST